MDEFDLIERCFKPLAGPEGLKLIDDAACIQPNLGFDLILSKDMLVSDVHFFRDDHPADIAHKVLAVNLSDIAAKGAVPRHYMLGLSLPSGLGFDWLDRFSNGLLLTQQNAGLYLIGGDTTKSPVDTITISVTIFGEVHSGQMIPRSGAKTGDDIYVTGQLGLAAFGLLMRQGKIQSDDQSLIERYLRPVARTKLGPALIGIAGASADISDGLLADIGHICLASEKGAQIYVGRLPVTETVSGLCKTYPEYRHLVWAGGDDYEIIFTAKATERQKIDELSNDFNTLITRVGHITDEKSVLLINKDGAIIESPDQGYKHF